MNAVRKPRPAHLFGGNKMGFLAAQVRHLTGDENSLLLLLVHHMGEEGCFPSQETLMEETGWSQRKVRRIRDALAAKGVIGFIAGTGHKSTRYSIPGLSAYAEEQRQKTAPRMPESAVEGLPPGGTEHLNTKLNNKPVLKLVGKGWPSLVHLAPEFQRDHWLTHLTFDGQDDDGTIRLTAPNTLTRDRVRTMLGEDPAIIALARTLGIDPEKVKIRADKPAGAGLPAESQVRDGEPGGFDHRRSMGRQFKENMDRLADKLEAASDQPVVPSRPQCNKVTDLAAYRTKKQVDTEKDT